MILFTILFISAYLVGSVNCSIILFNVLGKEDPRKHFSGNPGVTNVFRQSGFWLAGLVLLLDMGKSMLIAYFSKSLLPLGFVPWIALGLIAGNRFPCFHGFAGGKGVANYLGFVFAICPVPAALSLIAWLVGFGISRMPFIGSFSMVAILSIGAASAANWELLPGLGVFAVSIFIVYNHRRNIIQFVEKITGRGFNE